MAKVNTEPPWRKRQNAWLTANGLDISRILEQDPITVENGQITVQYVVPDGAGGVIKDGFSPIRRPHTVPELHPIEEFEDPTPVREFHLADDHNTQTEATFRVLADGRLQVQAGEQVWTMNQGDSRTAAGMISLGTGGLV